MSASDSVSSQVSDSSVVPFHSLRLQSIIRYIMWLPIGLFLAVYVLMGSVFSGIAEAARAEVRASGVVASFGSYSFQGQLLFQIVQPGYLEIGAVTVDGMYNGAYPWILRVYTDNPRYVGIGGAQSAPPTGGLVSSDGQYSIPLFVNCPNFGEGVWRSVPDRYDRTYRTYYPSERVGDAEYTECVIMGIDPRNADWVAGPDRRVGTEDDNVLGDTTLPTPFQIRFAVKVGQATVSDVYSGRVILEVISAP